MLVAETGEGSEEGPFWRGDGGDVGAGVEYIWGVVVG